jgi:radical SAM superfamily enzyme YgiQ (UPF0313 family)
MNILLIYPEFPDTFWSFKHALTFIRKKASLPPLGLMTVAALLPEEWEKRLVDANVQKLRARDLEWADYAFVSAMTVQRDSARQTIARCKKAGVPVVAGGPIFMSEHEQFEQVDHFVLNEAEITLPMFLDDLALGQPQPIYETSEFPDIRETPAPMWELANLKRYATMAIQYSRGCPFNCEFCNVTALLGHKPRIKSAEQIIDELDGLYDVGWRDKVFFVDDNFIGNKKALKSELLPALIEWQKSKRGFSFHTEASINLADDEDLMQLMVEAGFDTVFIGVETPDDCSLAECSKIQNKGRDMVEDVKRIQRAGLQVQGGFIVGFDSDTPSIFQRQIDFIQKSGIVTAMVGLLQAIPGTRLYDRLRREGRLQDCVSGDNVDGTTNIVPRMPAEILRDGYRRIMATIYSPKHYYERVKTFLREYKPPKIKSPLDFQHVMAFFRSVVRLGIIGKERFHYWKLLLWTLLHRPRLFEEAVTFAIYGYHFRKVSEAVVARDPRIVRRRRRRH